MQALSEEMFTEKQTTKKKRHRNTNTFHSLPDEAATPKNILYLDGHLTRMFFLLNFNSNVKPLYSEDHVI